ncbi:hypothetical protein [Rhodococcoides fascians]|uniref:hypothetical protein n=1 Tax=Rhodococcoides fascians TaxID=1828 RepID=UPI00197D5B13
MTPEPNRMLQGPNVLRVVWVPGADRLRGFCHCGSSRLEEDPALLWEWLLAHPIGHFSTVDPVHPELPSVRGDLVSHVGRAE